MGVNFTAAQQQALTIASVLALVEQAADRWDAASEIDALDGREGANATETARNLTDARACLRALQRQVGERLRAEIVATVREEKACTTDFLADRGYSRETIETIVRDGWLRRTLLCGGDLLEA